jgi:hypothetical protein
MNKILFFVFLVAILIINLFAIAVNGQSVMFIKDTNSNDSASANVDNKLYKQNAVSLALSILSWIALIGFGYFTYTSMYTSTE